MSTSFQQQRYLADSVSTASPIQLLVMLYDRLVLDLNRALAAQEAADRAAASEQIRHAQQIVAELRANLHTGAWDGADNLASLYAFILGELIAVNITPDVPRLLVVQTIVSDLRDAWRAAGLALLAQGAERPNMLAARVG